MKNLERKIKKRYLLFISTIGVIIISLVLIINHNINLQNSIIRSLNLSYKQGYLVERIENEAYIISTNKEALSNVHNFDKLKNLLDELETSHNYLYSNKLSESNNKVIDSLHKLHKPHYNKILASTRNIINNREDSVITQSLQTIWDYEMPFFKSMDRIVNSYEKEAVIKQQKLKNIVLLLAIIASLILYGEFLFILVPALKQLFEKNHDLIKTNNELAESEEKIKENILELTALKTDLEAKEKYHKIFIEQAPTAIAMLDNDMKYMAVSKRWISDYKMEGQEIIGKSHYDLFPEIGDDWKANHQKCLNGAINVCDEAPFKRADGSVQWIFWDVRPWYKSEGNIGGLLMSTGDITDVKKKDQEKIRIEKILESTNKVARIGTWELDITTDKYKLSNTTCEILKLPFNFEAFQKDSLLFYKEGVSRNKIINAFKEIKESGTSFDLELEMIASGGESVWVRKIGQAEYEDGKCKRISGIFQDISELKKSESELLKKNQLLTFAEGINMMGHWQWNTIEDKVLWSKNLYKMFELDEATIDLKFDSYFSFVHPEDKKIVSEYFEKAAKEKSFHSFTHRIITTTGIIKTVKLLGKVFTNEKGEITEMIGTGQDITEQKMSENKFRGLLESAPDAMVIVNENGIIDLVNKQAEKLFGYDAIELIGTSVELLIPKKFLNNNTIYRDDFFTKPKTTSMGVGKNLYGINKQGKEIPVQISIGPLQTEEGLLVSLAIRDITNQKLAERKVLESKENLEIFSKKLISQNTQLADFTHITSHNLRAPVSNLNSLLDFYKTAKSEKDKADLFEKFETVIQHLTLTLNTLIEALKTKNETDKELEEISFNKVLNKTKEILSGEILKVNATIKSDFTKIEKIKYNRIYLESIFLNLVGNAIKYKSEDRELELFIESDIKEGRIVLTFKDNGLGIDLKRHGHKLFGLNKVFHRHPDAKGVGLFMTKTQIEAMGGTISASSKVNVGTAFNINF